MKLIAQGAEAKLYQKESTILKKRISKTYRITELDQKLRKQRTRREVKILKKLAPLDFAPQLISTNNQDEIELEYIAGKKLAQCLETLDYLVVCKQLGAIIRQLHDLEIIHGDLTTSNILIRDKQLFLIDFGLSSFSTKIEDRAVDLHVLHEALTSHHHTIAQDAFKAILNGYNSKSVEKRLALVEARGRNKKGS